MCIFSLQSACKFAAEIYADNVYAYIDAAAVCLYICRLLVQLQHTLQHTATHCNTLQYAATRCNTM